jgi:hypothetical protein
MDKPSHTKHNKMKIILKDKWGFWFFKRYSFYMEDESESITEVLVNKDIWEKFGVGDYFDTHYHQFFKYDKRNK